jgi:16S rRNA (cytosine967-C5)-methyltransferase
MAKERQGMGAAKLVNAVLRRIDRERDALNIAVPSDPLAALALEYSHPLWLLQRWSAAFGMEHTRKLAELNNREPANFMRPYNTSNADFLAELHRAGAFMEAPPLLAEGARLVHGVAIAELGAFKRGWCFVQDPGATLAALYCAFPAQSVVADLCAAPGGKALETSRQPVTVVAGDRSMTRLTRFKDNLARLHAHNVLLFAGDAEAPPLREADCVLLDAPCTGTGTFRRHPDARWRLKVSDIHVMAAEQRVLLNAAASIVKPGGLLVYSTCSLEREENDDQVDSFLGANRGWQLEPPPAGTVPDEVLDNGLLRVLPYEHEIDGAFAARLRKHG